MKDVPYYTRWYRANKANIKERDRKRLYGLDAGRYDEIALAQEYHCAICDKEKPLVIDHDHDSGQVRGLLCRTCNTQLGWFERHMDSVIRYLE
ncbi:MAG TPA: endonuclease domain-containing protein [Patescibacteria group bacterium]|nr:endonuclease domain-containing protein [Patescibacteria group bacterium]